MKQCVLIDCFMDLMCNVLHASVKVWVGGLMCLVALCFLLWAIVLWTVVTKETVRNWAGGQWAAGGSSACRLSCITDSALDAVKCCLRVHPGIAHFFYAHWLQCNITDRTVEFSNKILQVTSSDHSCNDVLVPSVLICGWPGFLIANANVKILHSNWVIGFWWLIYTNS